MHNNGPKPFKITLQQNHLIFINVLCISWIVALFKIFSNTAMYLGFAQRFELRTIIAGLRLSLY